MSGQRNEMSREEWVEWRRKVWARRNALLNVVIITVCALILWRYCAT